MNKSILIFVSISLLLIGGKVYSNPVTGICENCGSLLGGWEGIYSFYNGSESCTSENFVETSSQGRHLMFLQYNSKTLFIEARGRIGLAPNSPIGEVVHYDATNHLLSYNLYTYDALAQVSAYDPKCVKLIVDGTSITVVGFQNETKYCNESLSLPTGNEPASCDVYRWEANKISTCTTAQCGRYSSSVNGKTYVVSSLNPIGGCSGGALQIPTELTFEPDNDVNPTQYNGDIYIKVPQNPKVEDMRRIFFLVIDGDGGNHTYFLTNFNDKQCFTQKKFQCNLFEAFARQAGNLTECPPDNAVASCDYLRHTFTYTCAPTPTAPVTPTPTAPTPTAGPVAPQTSPIDGTADTTKVIINSFGLLVLAIIGLLFM